jgi:hypothetical protein
MSLLVCNLLVSSKVSLEPSIFFTLSLCFITLQVHILFHFYSIHQPHGTKLFINEILRNWILAILFHKQGVKFLFWRLKLLVHWWLIRFPFSINLTNKIISLFECIVFGHVQSRLDIWELWHINIIIKHFIFWWFEILITTFCVESRRTLSKSGSL